MSRFGRKNIQRRFLLLTISNDIMAVRPLHCITVCICVPNASIMGDPKFGAHLKLSSSQECQNTVPPQFSHETSRNCQILPKHLVYSVRTIPSASWLVLIHMYTTFTIFYSTIISHKTFYRSLRSSLKPYNNWRLTRKLTGYLSLQIRTVLFFFLL